MTQGNAINSFMALYDAYKATRKGKHDNPTACKYRINAVTRTAALARRLQAYDYTVGPYYPFEVYEPKHRQVLALDYEGKIVQHSLCDNALYPAFVPRFIRDNYASQIGKGTHDGLDRLTKALRHYYFSRKAADAEYRRANGLPLLPPDQCHYADGWVLKGDISKYFYSIDHTICRDVSHRALQKISDADTRDFAIWLLDLFIDSTEDPGIPIGNQSSQLLALLYLDAMDHWMKDDLGLIYGRYMDDFYIIHEDKKYLQDLLRQITDYVESIGLKLNPKTQIFPLKNGIDFLGFHTYLTESGKVIRKIRAKSANNMRRKIVKFRRLVDAGRMTLDSVRDSYTSWRGHAEHGDTYHMIKRMDAHFYRYFPELEPEIRPESKKVNTDAPADHSVTEQGEDQVRYVLRRTHHLAEGRRESYRVSRGCGKSDHCQYLMFESV